MSTGITSDMAPFVQRMVAGKRFLNEQEVLAEGLRLLQARKTLREEVVKGFEQLDAGQGIPPSGSMRELKSGSPKLRRTCWILSNNKPRNGVST